MAGSRKTHPYIEQKRGVCGGRPVIKGVRFLVNSVAIQYQQGLTTEDILREFLLPLTTSTIRCLFLGSFLDTQ